MKKIMVLIIILITAGFVLSGCKSIGEKAKEKIMENNNEAIDGYIESIDELAELEQLQELQVLEEMEELAELEELEYLQELAELEALLTELDEMLTD